jgi:hypothetical protein
VGIRIPGRASLVNWWWLEWLLPFQDKGSNQDKGLVKIRGCCRVFNVKPFD